MEKIFNQGIDENQSFIEFSPLMIKYLKSICKKVKSSTGGILLIDYGTFNKKLPMIAAIHVGWKGAFKNILKLY